MLRYERPDGRARLGSRVFTRANVMSANPPHHSPAERSEIRTVSSLEIPSLSDRLSRTRFTASSKPPPR